MPSSTTGRLCPICDSPIEQDAKKCSFCGTDLSMFESEAKEARKEEGKIVRDTYSPTGAKLPTPMPPPKDLTPKVEPVKTAITEESIFECPACGGKVKESDRVCPNCGASFEEETQFECPACETLVNADAQKCPGCGAQFIEDESATEQVAPVAQPVKPASQVHEAAAPAVDKEEKDEELDKIISTAKKMRDTRDAEKVAKAAEVAKKKKSPRRRFGIFKAILTRDGEAAKKEEKPSAEAPKTKETVDVKKAPTDEETESSVTAAAEASAAPTKRQWPSDPREQGKELARLVAEVRSLLSTAMQREIYIDETKEMLEMTITAGRERQFIQALDIISDGQEKLHNQLKEYIDATIISLGDELSIAKRLGANPTRAEVFIKEANRAVQTSDFQAALIFIDKSKHELEPVTGRYNETRVSLRKFERLVKDSRFIGIDNEPFKKVYDDAKAAFDKLDFPKADGIIKKNTDEILAQIPERMGDEIEIAKQMLIEAKMKTDVGMAPQIAILKSAIRNLQEEKYLAALAELKRFKKEMKKLLSSA